MGVRPLKTTFVNLIESNFSEILCNLQIEHDNIDEIDWAFSKERQTFIINVRNKERANIVLEHPVTLTIENNLTTVFSENKPNLIYVSGQNIDRLVSIYKASQKAGKTLVVDVYIAKILKTLSKYNKFPIPNKSYNIKVWFTKYVCDRLARLSRKDILYEFAGYKISKDDINMQPSEYVFLTRPSQIVDMEKIPNLKLGNFIYSLWEGYKNNPDTIKLLDWIRKRKFTEHNIHTSGHADQESLLCFVNAFNPRYIIPIHTLQKNKYSRIFTQNVISLRDGEKLEL